MSAMAEHWVRISEIVDNRAAELGLSMSEVRRRAGDADGKPMDHKTVAKMRDGQPLGTDRSRFRLARALDWPGGAIGLLLDGAEPESLPTVPWGDPDDSPDGPAVAQLRQDRADDQRVISYLVRQLEAVRRVVEVPAVEVDEATEALVAAYSGDPSSVDFEQPGSTTRARVSWADPDDEPPA